MRGSCFWECDFYCRSSMTTGMLMMLCMSWTAKSFWESGKCHKCYNVPHLPQSTCCDEPCNIISRLKNVMIIPTCSEQVSDIWLDLCLSWACQVWQVWQTYVTVCLRIDALFLLRNSSFGTHQVLINFCITTNLDLENIFTAIIIFYSITLNFLTKKKNRINNWALYYW